MRDNICIDPTSTITSRTLTAEFLNVKGRLAHAKTVDDFFLDSFAQIGKFLIFISFYYFASSYHFHGQFEEYFANFLEHIFQA